MRDDEAARFSTSLYRQLAAGKDLAGALAAARSERAAAGAPAEAWAGTVLIGNGRIVPVGRGVRGTRPLGRFAALVAILVASLAAWRGFTLHRAGPRLSPTSWDPSRSSRRIFRSAVSAKTSSRSRLSTTGPRPPRVR